MAVTIEVTHHEGYLRVTEEIPCTITGDPTPVELTKAVQRVVDALGLDLDV